MYSLCHLFTIRFSINTSYSKCSVSEPHSLVYMTWVDTTVNFSLCPCDVGVKGSAKLFCFCCHSNVPSFLKRREKPTNLQQIHLWHSSHEPTLGPELQGLIWKTPEVLNAGWREPFSAFTLHCCSDCCFEGDKRGRLSKLEAFSSIAWMLCVV